MAERREQDTWLVACWPGMGRVATLAGQQLVGLTHATRRPAVRAERGASLDRIVVEEGLVHIPRLAEDELYALPAGACEHEILVLLGGSQSVDRPWEYCESVLDQLGDREIHRIVTFAAMATPSAPTAASRVFVAATQPDVLAQLPEEDVVHLEGGEISGLNGLLLGVAAQRGLEGLCLLGEFPYFAAGLPNPKASAAVLRLFCGIAGLDLDLRLLDAQAAQVEQQLVLLLDQLQGAGAEEGEDGTDEEEPPEFPGTPETPAPPEEPERPRLRPEQTARLEQLFEAAVANREKALELKAELDRLGVFTEFEDRFLDLFRRGE